MDTVIDLLGRHVPRVNSDVITRWVAAEPALAPASCSAELIARCHRDGNPVLAALLRIAAADTTAAEVVLAAMAPGLSHLTRRLRRPCGDPDETAARAAEAAWETILEFAGAPPSWPATAILDRVRDVVRLAARADGRRVRRDTPVAACPDGKVIDCPCLGATFDAAARVAHLTAADAHLVWITRVGGFSLAEVAKATGLRHDSLRRRRARAERALRAAA